VTAPLKYLNIFAEFLLAELYSFTNLAVIQENMWSLSNYSKKSPYYSGIIPDSFTFNSIILKIIPA